MSRYSLIGKKKLYTQSTSVCVCVWVRTRMLFVNVYKCLKKNTEETEEGDWGFDMGWTLSFSLYTPNYLTFYYFMCHFPNWQTSSLNTWVDTYWQCNFILAGKNDIQLLSIIILFCYLSFPLSLLDTMFIHLFVFSYGWYAY